jgi:hypothetical protein
MRLRLAAAGLLLACCTAVAAAFREYLARAPRRAAADRADAEHRLAALEAAPSPG